MANSPSHSVPRQAGQMAVSTYDLMWPVFIYTGSHLKLKDSSSCYFFSLFSIFLLTLGQMLTIACILGARPKVQYLIPKLISVLTPHTLLN